MKHAGGTPKGHKWKRSPEGIILNKDGTPRSNAIGLENLTRHEYDKKMAAKRA